MDKVPAVWSTPDESRFILDFQARWPNGIGSASRLLLLSRPPCGLRDTLRRIIFFGRGAAALVLRLKCENAETPGLAWRGVLRV